MLLAHRKCTHIIMTANINATYVLTPLLNSLIHSYKTVMQQCWHGNPDQRPTFSQLRAQIDTVITAMAGYLEFSMIAPCVELDKVYVFLYYVHMLKTAF